VATNDGVLVDDRHRREAVTESFGDKLRDGHSGHSGIAIGATGAERNRKLIVNLP
jgi:hypothetical protein